MPAKGIVTGQRVDRVKAQRSKELRRHQTDEEKLLWERLRGKRLDGWHFRRQQIIDGFIVDFYCHAAGLVVELDGPIHDRQIEYDRERDRVLSARGISVLRVRNEEVVADMAGVLSRIQAACREGT